MSTTNGAVAPLDQSFRIFAAIPEERATIGGIIECSEQESELRIAETLDFLHRKDFHRVEHRLIWDAILDLRGKTLHCGRDAVVNWLDTNNKFSDSFKPFDIDQILREAPRPLIPLEPAKRVKEMAQLREMVSAHERVKRIYETATDPGAAFQHALDVMEQVRPVTATMGRPKSEMTFSELMAMQFPPRVPAVQHFFDEAKSYLIVGGPKAGKSIFVVQCAIAMASGTNALISLATGKPRDVLYVCLDDGEENCQARSRAMFNAAGANVIPRITYRFSFEPEESKARYFRAWAEDHPGGFIFIDILENIRDGFPPPKGSQDRLYAADYWALRWTSDLAHGPNRCGVAVVHHTNKAKDEGGNPLNTASGTQALMGAVDAGIVFHDRPLSEPINRVTVTGRNQAQESYELEWNDLVEGWEFLGVAKPPTGSKPRSLGRQRQAILDCVQQASTPLRAHDIAARTGQAPGPTRRLLRKMLWDKQLVQYTDRAYDHPAEVGRRNYAYPLATDITGPDPDDDTDSPGITGNAVTFPPLPDTDEP